MAEILIGSIKKGEAGGVAELDASGRVPSTQLPSYVDDVLDQLAEEASALAAADTVLGARIDNIIAPEGDPSLTELADIRVGYDGATYATAGSSVRGSDMKLDDKITAIHTSYVQSNGNSHSVKSENVFDKTTRNAGHYIGSDGFSIREGSAYAHSDWISVDDLDKVSMASGFIPSNAMFFYDAEKTTLIQTGTVTSFIGLAIPEGAKFMRFNLGEASSDTAVVKFDKTVRHIDYSQVDNVPLINIEIVHVGSSREHGTLKSAVEYANSVASETNHVNIEIDAGTYNALDGFNLAQQTSSFVGLVIGDYVNLVGVSSPYDTVISAELPSDISSYQFERNNVSTLNLWTNNRLENLTVKAKNIRYAVHNDDFKVRAVEDAVEEFVNCRFIYESLSDGVDGTSLSKVPFGTGAAKGRKMRFSHCVFETLEASSKIAALFHNNTQQIKPCEFEFECCKFVGGWGGSVKVSSAGSGQEDMMTFKGCKGDKIRFAKESVYTGTTPEFKLYGYGNSFTGYSYEGVEQSADNAETEMML